MLTCLLSAVGVGLLFAALLVEQLVRGSDLGTFAQFLGSTLYALPLFFIALILPFVLTLENLLFLLLPPRKGREERGIQCVEVVTVLLGLVLSGLYLMLTDIRNEDWYVQLIEIEQHTPIATWTQPSVIVVSLLALAGYVVLRFVPLRRQPPLLTVLGMAAMYLGAGIAVLWMIQVGSREFLLCLLPANCILIAARTIRCLLVQRMRLEAEGAPSRLPRLVRFLDRAAAWPFLALLAAVPLLGVLIAVLALFGQAPDSLIQAWTQTADWTLSQQIPPPSLPYDGHYLCTVAAGGHRRLVRPLRTGKRHGHTVLVNRQLCVANAFEQLLQERVPRFHRAVRGFYDRTGYPIARHIRSPYVADAVYLLMKPLEWLFLAVLYLFDVRPENRIAVQYPHAPIPSDNNC